MIFSAMVARVIITTLILATFVATAPAKSKADVDNGIWRIDRQWNDADESAFQDFIVRLAKSRERTTDRLLKESGNIYREQNPKGKIYFYADCADLPYVLRAYFAYMNNLPFSWTSGVRSLDGSRDVRYSPNGNVPIRKSFVADGDSLMSVLRKITGEVTTAVFRIAPGEKRTIYRGVQFPDHYPLKLGRSAIAPGTILYDPAGHVAIVYEVDESGRVHLMDGHPDNSITYISYGKKFVRSRPAAGAGFKAWRPVTYSADFKSVTSVPNGSLSHFGTEQYHGTHPDPAGWMRGRFVLDGKELTYYDYVRSALSEGALRYNPNKEFRALLDGLVYDIEARQHAVDAALKRKIHLKSHPARLPRNIYGTYGEWESYSTPARDARLKTSFREVRTTMEDFVRMIDEGSDRIGFKGGSEKLRRELLAVYRQYADKVVASYTASNGEVRELTFQTVEDRLFLLSFDPYHGPELRWGADGVKELLETGRVPMGSKLSSLRDSDTKIRWYIAEQRLRNQIDRKYDVRMDFNLDQLGQLPPLNANGVGSAPEVAIESYLAGGNISGEK